jgi:hypothetical protein
MPEDPTILARAQVKIQRSSLDKTDTVQIKKMIPREIIDQYPCLLLPIHLRHIIGPCPRPPQAFQAMSRSIAHQKASDGSVEN